MLKCMSFMSMAVVLLGLIGSVRADVNYSYTLDGDSAGFIGRGKVISHPALGKAALVDAPTVRLQVQQTYSIAGTVEVETQTTGQPSRRMKVDIVGQYVTTESFNVNTRVIVVSRKAKGNDNINGYVIGDVDPSSTGGQTPPQVGDVLKVPASKITVISATQQSDGMPYSGNLNSIFNGIQDVTVTAVELLGSGQETLVFDAGNGLVGEWLLDEFGDGHVPELVP
jgi:hypothetical protein